LFVYKLIEYNRFILHYEIKITLEKCGWSSRKSRPWGPISPQTEAERTQQTITTKFIRWYHSPPAGDQSQKCLKN
jgi:hypothetical protein